MALTKVTFSMIDGAMVNVLDYGADQTGSTDSTAAITAALATGSSVYFPEGTYLTTGGHTVNDKQSIIGDGIQKTIIQSSQTTGTCFNLPLTGTNEAAVTYGGNKFMSFTLEGAASTNPTYGFKIKNKTDILFEHVEILEFGYGVSGVRDNASNSCTAITFIAPRIRQCGIGLYAPLYWNGLKVYGGDISGTTASVIVYDSQDVSLDAIWQGGNSQKYSVFLGGCSSFKISGYCEGDTTNDAFIGIASQKDIDGNASVNGINIATSYGGIVEKCHFSSGPGCAYGIKVDGANKIAFVGNSAGSGISTALVYLTTGVTKCVAIGNNSNSGTIIDYQTGSDANNNLEYDDNAQLLVVNTQKTTIAGGVPPDPGLAGGLVSVCGADTGHLFMDNSRNNDAAGLYINNYGYLGGQTKYRTLYIQDGKGSTVLAVEPSVSANIVRLNGLPTSSAGLATGTVWNDAGTLKIV